MQFTQALLQFGQKTGLDGLKLDGDGACSLLFDDSIEVDFKADGGDGSVFFCCAMGSGSELAGDLDAARRLLSSSLLGAKTGGGAFGINEDADELLLWKRFDDCFEDENDLESKINAFLEEAINWKRILNSGSSQDVDAPDDEAESQVPANALMA